MPDTMKRNANAKRRLFGEHTEEQGDIHARLPTSAASHDDHVVTILETPQKKQKSDHDFFSSPKGKPVVTPDKVGDDDVEVFSSPVKKARLSELYSPQKKVMKSKEETYVPTYVHKNLAYKRKGIASLPSKVKATFELVQDHYDIPVDFEQSRFYGPLSGTSYEERVISAYNLLLLEPKDGDPVQICSSCIKLGHKRNDCPDLI